MVHYYSLLRPTAAQRTAIDNTVSFMARPLRLSIVGCVFADLGNTHWECGTGYTWWASFAMVSPPNSQSRLRCSNYMGRFRAPKTMGAAVRPQGSTRNLLMPKRYTSALHPAPHNFVGTHSDTNDF